MAHLAPNGWYHTVIYNTRFINFKTLYVHLSSKYQMHMLINHRNDESIVMYHWLECRNMQINFNSVTVGESNTSYLSVDALKAVDVS